MCLLLWYLFLNWEHEKDMNIYVVQSYMRLLNDIVVAENYSNCVLSFYRKVNKSLFFQYVHLASLNIFQEKNHNFPIKKLFIGSYKHYEVVWKYFDFSDSLFLPSEADRIPHKSNTFYIGGGPSSWWSLISLTNPIHTHCCNETKTRLIPTHYEVKR